jgi:CarboxypepD_reg-like domain/TonB-dependent Receptor Plug Domain
MEVGVTHSWIRCLLLCVLGSISFITYAQDGLSQKVTFQIVDQTLKETLRQLENTAGVRFSYNPKKLPLEKKISIQAANETIEQVLKKIIQQVPLQYTYIEGQFVLQPIPETGSSGQKKSTLSGYVKDRSTGEAMIGASIYIPLIGQGAVANHFGFYSLTVDAGIYEVQYSFIGYKNEVTQIDLTASKSQNVYLQEASPLLQPVIIRAGVSDLPEVPQTGNISVQPEAIQERPSLLGETDVIKSLESVPGVKSHSDGSTFYYVRGGQRDQNLILIDDAPIYNPAHLLGLFSSIIPDAINDMTLYKGDMPASLGGRISSVLDIRTKKGNDQHFQWWGSVGLVSNKIGVEGPIKKNKSSFLVSTRFSRLKWLAQLGNQDIDQFRFTDFTSKLNVDINQRNRIFFSLTSGSDNYFAGNAGIRWSNLASTLRWNHLFSDKLFANTTASVSGYRYELFTDRSTNTRWNSQIANLQLKSDLTYFKNPRNEISGGLGVFGYFFDPGNIRSDQNVSTIPVLSIRNSSELVMYGNHQVNVSERWSLSYGLRFTHWANLGEAFEFDFDETGNVTDTLRYQSGERYIQFLNAEPRFTASYAPSAQSTVKLSYTRTVQNMHQIINTTSPFTSLEVWLPSSQNIKPQIANQWVVGYYHGLVSTGIDLSAEGFYKILDNQIEYEDHAETLLNPLVERELRFGQGRAYGVEFLAKKETGRLRGWLGYSYARAKRTFDGVNGGREFNAFFDRPHQVNTMLTYDVSHRWTLGVNWNYVSGAPFSSPISFYQFNGLEVPLYGQRNNDRLPDYHRMDVSALVKLNKSQEKKFQHTLSLSIYNFYARKNPVFINFNQTEGEDGIFRIPSNLLNAQRTTSQLYLFQWVPSLSYHFKWR